MLIYIFVGLCHPRRVWHPHIYTKKNGRTSARHKKKKSPAELIAYRADRVPIEMHSYHPLLSPEDKTSKCALKKKAEEEREMNAISK